MDLVIASLSLLTHAMSDTMLLLLVWGMSVSRAAPLLSSHRPPNIDPEPEPE